MAQVLLRGVRKGYPGGPVVLDGVDLTVHDGEIMAVLGPSGVGKSTLLRVVVGLERCEEGTILVGSEDVTDAPPRARNAAYIPQSGALFPHLSVEGNLAFPLRQRETEPDEISRAVRRAAARWGLGRLLLRRPEALSRGEQQETALGRATIRDVEIVCMDEPLSDVDPRGRSAARRALRAYHEATGATILLATNEQREVIGVAHRVAVLQAGGVAQVGSFQAVYDHPVNAGVAAFVGDPGMNILHARVEDRLIRVGGAALEVTRLPQAARAGVGRAVLLGIRPEDVRLGSAMIADESIPAEVVLVERLGARSLVHTAVGGVDGGREAIVVSASARVQVAKGDRVALAMAKTKLHWFDADSGLRLG